MELLINTGVFRVTLKAVFSFSGKQPFCSYWFCSTLLSSLFEHKRSVKLFFSVAECVQPGSLRFGKKTKQNCIVLAEYKLVIMFNSIQKYFICPKRKLNLHLKHFLLVLCPVHNNFQLNIFKVLNLELQANWC